VVKTTAPISFENLRLSMMPAAPIPGFAVEKINPTPTLRDISTGRFDCSKTESQMRGIQASEAKTHLPQLLDAVEHEETIITRHDRSDARPVPEHHTRQERISGAAVAGLRDLREAIRERAEKPFTLDEIKAYRDEGRS
jgi:antitoxin (DNA-binding transcriptional repressor) of toxin-antitoxin stability system